MAWAVHELRWLSKPLLALALLFQGTTRRRQCRRRKSYG
jgi:hypothetical protein